MIEVTHERLPTLQNKQRLVGMLEGGENFALTDRSYVLLESYEAIVRTSYLFIPKTSLRREAMNITVNEVLKTPQKYKFDAREAKVVQFYTFERLVKNLCDGLGFLYTVLAFADGLVIIAVVLLEAFLANIYFEQRLTEFGLLSAFGFQRERLAQRLVIESGSLIFGGWVFGLALTWITFKVLDETFMKPNGLILANLRQTALLYTLPAPILVAVTSLGTILIRLYKLDPIEIMERR